MQKLMGLVRRCVDDYNMISSDYAKSVYIDVKEDERIVLYDKSFVGESFIETLLKAIGLIGD